MTAASEASQPSPCRSLRGLTTPILAAVAVLALSVTLVVTIYFTQLDIQWVAFLLGVLFAAVVGMVTMTVKAQWLLAQSRSEVEHQKELLAEEIARGERQTQAFKTAEARFRAMLDSMSQTPADTCEAEQTEVAPPEVASETAYLDAMEQQLDSGGKAREHLLQALEENHFLLLEQRIEALTPEGLPNLREILLRLQEEAERTLPPAEFFEIAERYELMPAIDRWVIRRLLKCCAAMKEADRKWRMPLYCLNVSGATLRDRGFANHVRAQLQHWDIAGSRLCFEIHHGAFAEQQADIAVLMAQLKPLGCRFAVDGFGSHKVSFTPFRELRFDYLKIDGSIVSQVLRNPSELTKVKAIVVACDKIGVQTIAQFVEDDATRTALKEAGVDYVQGFGIDKPGPLAAVATTGAALA